MKKVLTSLLMLGVLTSGSYATCQASGCYDVNVEKVLVTTTGDILVATSGTEASLDCPSVVNQYMTVTVNNPGKNAMYSMFLTAQTTNKKVSMAIIPSSSGCKISYAYIK